MKKVKNIFTLIVLTISFLGEAQVRRYTKIDKINRDSYNFIESNKQRKKQKKDKSLYTVYCDQENVIAYEDKLGFKQSEKQKFLTPYYVIDESKDYLQVVSFDPSLIGKPKGIFSFFYGKKYNFKDYKKVSYIGWINKNNLLRFSHPKTNPINLQPIQFFLGINHLEDLYKSKKYIKKDSVFIFKDPKLTIKSDKVLNLNQFVYLYKYNRTRTAALVSNLKNMKQADSTARKMGWVPANLITNIGHRAVYKVKNRLYTNNSDKKKKTIIKRDIAKSFIFKADDNYKNEEQIDSANTKVIIPINIWDHHNNTLINIKGGSVYTRQIPFIKQQQKTFNFHFIFDCSSELKNKMKEQIASLQKIWLLLSEDEKYKDYNFLFSAQSYGCNDSYKLPKTKSFISWVDYIQKALSNDSKNSKKSFNTEQNNIEACFENIINTPRGFKKFENNIILVFGEKDIHLSNIKDTTLKKLANISGQILFFQLENSSEIKHQDYILNAKQILDTVGKHYKNFITDYIIENEFDIKTNTFASIDSEENNIYIYDAPKNSLYNGGIVFPKINKTLTPISFDIAIDSVLNKIISTNKRLINSLNNGMDKLSFLRSSPTRYITGVIDNINRYSVSKLPRNNKNEQFLIQENINLTKNTDLKYGYLLTKEELNSVIEGYKSIIPLMDRELKSRDRRVIYKKYKKYIKYLNKSLFFKELKRSKSLAKLLYTKTGIPVKNETLNTLRIKDVKRKRKISNIEFNGLITDLRAKIIGLEQIIENPSSEQFLDGSNTVYYFIAEDYFL